MSSDANFTPAPDGNPPAGPQGAAPAAPPTGLPPVSPPSGKLMMQLFLVPGLIVAFLVAAWLVGGWLFGGSYSKKDFLDKLRDSNAEVRWRAAEQLAQVLLRDDALAADGDFARELGGILEDKRKESGTAEKDYENAVKAYKESLGKPEFTEEQRQQKKDSMDAQRRNLEPARNLISYLTAALGDFIVPVGAPVLKDLATSKDATILQRRQAVWAMANLGQNLKRFDALRFMEMDAVLHNLEAASSAGENAEWVCAALYAALQRPRPSKRLRRHGASRHADLVQRGEGQTYLRELSAFAMNFWRGDDAANERMEKRLVDLMTKDDGSGRNSAAELSEEKDESPNAPSATAGRSLQIEYFAAVSGAASASQGRQPRRSQGHAG